MPATSAAAHVPHQAVGEAEDAHGDLARVQQLGGQDEEGHGDQQERVHAVHDLDRHRDQRHLAAGRHGHEGGEA
jgi:hypothetical protein